MMKSILCSVLVFFIVALIGCTKDTVPDPATANVNQEVIYYQNFNIGYPNFPAGWTSSSSNGWAMDTSIANNSSGVGASGVSTGEGTYPGASGGAMVQVSNPTSGNGGTYTLTVTGVISTVDYSDITVIWGIRNSKHFSDSGSVISFAWSSNGTTWNTVANWTNSTGNSDWALADNGVRIPLPAGAAGIPNLSFQWTATLFVNPAGSYRLDDFWVYGTP
jgi:hypothetical protein